MKLGIATLTACVLAASAWAEKPAAAPDQAVSSACECALSPRCWRLAVIAFAHTSGLSKREVEGSIPGRFFPGTNAEALHHADSDGHFLKVECGPQRVSCSGYRDTLEKRLAEASIVRSLPLHLPEQELIDPATWALRGRGIGVLSELHQCRPGFWKELAPILVADNDFWD